MARMRHDEIKWRVQALIYEKGMTEYAQLMSYLFYSGMRIEWEIASCNTYFFDRFLRSLREDMSGVDPETGEVLEQEKGGEKNGDDE